MPRVKSRGLYAGRRDREQEARRRRAVRAMRARIQAVEAQPYRRELAQRASLAGLPDLALVATLYAHGYDWIDQSLTERQRAAELRERVVQEVSDSIMAEPGGNRLDPDQLTLPELILRLDDLGEKVELLGLVVMPWHRSLAEDSAHWQG